ncbi:ORF V: Enzymatic polyprotein [Labeo rohita]|uniref:ribonuclease H n=1 Tax=Labeo rohita TaxID=84645 RepID=A0ABQ8MEG1_LABRO|nr:ORF V: Enzymatic polyprotein [Labeo rohita]
MFEQNISVVCKNYCAVAQGATALHAMATLQVYQAKALKELHKGSPGQEERHLWLNLPQMADVDKARFLDAPVSQASLFGDTVEDFAQQFSAVQKQTEAIKHILPRRDTVRKSPGAQPQPARRRGRPPAAPKKQEQSAPSPAEAHDAALAARRRGRRRGPGDGGSCSSGDDNICAPTPGGGPGPSVCSAAVDLRVGALEPVPPAEMKSGFYSPYFIVPKKSGGLQPILDLRVLNRSLLRLPFKMLTLKRILSCVRHQDWFAAIDLKDAYFHVSILPRHRPFLRFAFEGRPYQYKVLPFGLSLSPRIFTKVAEGALNPLWRKGIRILNYLDDWLIMAHSRDLLCEHRDLVLQHLSHLGLRVNREKSKLSPVQRISFLGMELDSVNMTACLTNERTQSVLNCLKSFRHKTAVPLKTFKRLLGHMPAAAAVTPLGLLHMRTLQRWLHDRVPRWAWHRGTLRIGVSPQCRRLFSPWSDPAFLRAGVPLGQVSRHVVVHTDASTMGWGAVCNGQAASGSWMGPRLLWHISCLELLAVLLALRRFLPMHKHVLVRTDNTATVAYINRQGGLRSCRMSQLARHLLLWSQTRLKSLRTVHIPGELNRAVDQLSRQPTHPGEWRLHPQTVQLIWSRFGEAQIDLFASPESSHCQLYYSPQSSPLREAPLGRDVLAHSWPPGPKYAFPPVSLLAQTLCKIREDGEQVLLVAPYWPTRTWFVDLTLLATAPPRKIPLRKDLLSQGMGTIWHPRPDLWNLHVWLLDRTR